LLSPPASAEQHRQVRCGHRGEAAGIKIGCKVLRLCGWSRLRPRVYGLTPQSRDLIEVWAALAEGKELTEKQIRNARMQFSLAEFCMGQGARR